MSTFRKKGTAESDLLRFLDDDPDTHIKAKVWMRWVNHVLKTSQLQEYKLITDLRELNTGVTLCQLAEVLSGKSLSEEGGATYTKDATLQSEFISNVNMALSHLRKDGMPVAQFPSSIFTTYNEKQVIKFVWHLIRQYSDDIGDFGLSRWCNRRTAQFEVFVEDWRDSWRDGRAFVALAKYFDKDIADDDLIKQNRKLTESELNAVFANIESKLKITQLIEPQELDHAINPENMLTTYIGIFYHQYGPPADFRALEDKNKLAEKKIIRLEYACREAHQEIQKRSQQLNKANTELKYMVNSQKEIVEKLNQQRELTSLANERITGLEMKISFYLSPAANIPVPTGPVCVVVTKVINESEFWDIGSKTASNLLGMHNSTLLELLELTGGYIAGSEGGSFTLAFTQAISALRFCTLSQKKLLSVEWPEEISEEEIWQSAIGTPAEGEEALWKGPRVAMALKYFEPVHYTEPVSGRVTFAGPEMQLLQRILQSAQGGQIIADKLTWEVLMQEEENETLEEDDETDVKSKSKSKSKKKDDGIEVLEEVLPSKVVVKPLGRFELEAKEKDTADGDVNDECDHVHEEGAAKEKEESKGITIVVEDFDKDDSDHITLLQVSHTDLAGRTFKPTEFTSLKTGENQKKEIIDKLETLSEENNRLKNEVEKTKNEFEEVSQRATALVSLFKAEGVSTDDSDENASPLAMELKLIYQQQAALRDDLALTKRRSEATMDYIKRLNDDLKSANFDSQLMSRKFKQISSIHKECGETIMKLRARVDQLASMGDKKKRSLFSKIKSKMVGDKHGHNAQQASPAVSASPSQYADDETLATETLDVKKFTNGAGSRRNSINATDAPTETLDVNQQVDFVRSNDAIASPSTEYPSVKTGVLEGADEVDFENPPPFDGEKPETLAKQEHTEEAKKEPTSAREASTNATKEPSVSVSPTKESAISTAQIKPVTPRDDASAASSDVSVQPQTPQPAQNNASLSSTSEAATTSTTSAQAPAPAPAPAPALNPKEEKAKRKEEDKKREKERKEKEKEDKRKKKEEERLKKEALKAQKKSK